MAAIDVEELYEGLDALIDGNLRFSSGFFFREPYAGMERSFVRVLLLMM